MNRAYFRFHAGLNHFLPRRQKQQTIVHEFDWNASIKDMIESLGVPHPEIEAITVNGVPVDFDYLMLDDNHVDVYPPPVDIPNAITLRPPVPNPIRFVLDTHLGRLASYLRMMGFDTLYRNDYPDDELAYVSSTEERVLLTRDLGLLKRGIVTHGYFVRDTNPPRQLVEITRRYGLAGAVQPFKRCTRCNGLLAWVAKEDVMEHLREDTAMYYDEFHQCQSCGQVYWKGSHHQRMRELLEQVLAAE